MSELLASTKGESARVASDIGKKASEVGGLLSNHAGRLANEATRSVKAMLDKTKRSGTKKR